MMSCVDIIPGPDLGIDFFLFVRMAEILTICMRQVRFGEKPRKPKFQPTNKFATKVQF